jgi:hypothetical protein
MNQYNPGNQTERAKLMKEDASLRAGERPATTFHEQSQHPQEILPKPEASPLAYPAMPADSPWGGARLPDEPLVDGTAEGNTLNYPINRVLP